MRLLIVEDEDLLRHQLETGLVQHGFIVDAAADGRNGLYYGTEYDYDAAIIDLGLPEIDGITLIEELRRAGRTFPVLILTARGDWHEKVKGLNAGADDYVVKPYHLEEIVARVNALLRRAAGFAHSSLEFSPIHIDLSAKRVLLKNSSVDLTAYEYKLLEYLMLNAGKVISKAQLTEHLYAQDHDRDSNVLEVFVRRLRQKLDPDQSLNPIETVRGQGYRFDLELVSESSRAEI
ncbi:MAG: response regulator transcription factor [OM182 bacterium]|nr:response regulator transcription factor [OM182 bacterium]